MFSSFPYSSTYFCNLFSIAISSNSKFPYIQCIVTFFIVLSNCLYVLFCWLNFIILSNIIILSYLITILILLLLLILFLSYSTSLWILLLLILFYFKAIISLYLKLFPLLSIPILVLDYL